MIDQHTRANAQAVGKFSGQRLWRLKIDERVDRILRLASAGR